MSSSFSGAIKNTYHNINLYPLFHYYYYYQKAGAYDGYTHLRAQNVALGPKRRLVEACIVVCTKVSVAKAYGLCDLGNFRFSDLAQRWRLRQNKSGRVIPCIVDPHTYMNINGSLSALASLTTIYGSI